MRAEIVKAVVVDSITYISKAHWATGTPSPPPPAASKNTVTICGTSMITGPIPYNLSIAGPSQLYSK